MVRFSNPGLFVRYLLVSVIFAAVTFVLLTIFNRSDLYLDTITVVYTTGIVFVATSITSLTYYFFFKGNSLIARFFVFLLGIIPIVFMINFGYDFYEIDRSLLPFVMAGNMFLSFAFMYFILIAVYEPIGRFIQITVSEKFTRDSLVIFVGAISLFCATSVSMYLADIVYPHSLFEYRIARTEFIDVVLFNAGQFMRGFPSADIVETIGYEPSPLSANLENAVFTSARLVLNFAVASAFFPLLGFRQRRRP